MAEPESDLNFELKVGLASFAEFRAPWLELASQYGSSFLHFPAWYESFYQHSTLQALVLLGYDAARALQFVGVFHVRNVRFKKSPSIKLLELAYQNEMGVCDVLCPHAQVSKERILQCLRSKGVVFQLARFRGIAQNSQANRMWHLGAMGKYSHPSKYLELSMGCEAFYGAYSKKFVRNLRRKHKKAEAKGELRLECFADERAQAGLSQFLDLEDSGWKGKKGTSIRCQAQQLALYQSLAEQLAAAGALRILLLFLGNQCIAGQFCAQFGGKLSLLKIAFNEDYGEVSPGDLIIDQVIQASPGLNQVQQLSFVTGVGWMDKWKPQVEPVYVMYGAAQRHWSLALSLILKIKNTTERWRTRLISN